MYWEFHDDGGKIAVRKGNWKGIKLNYSKNPNGKILLYDLSTDIHGDNNLADKYPNVVSDFEAIIKKREPHQKFLISSLKLKSN